MLQDTSDICRACTVYEIQGSRSCDQITVTASKKSVNLCRFYLASGILRIVTQCVCAFKQEIALRKLSYHSVHCFKIPRTYVALVPYTEIQGSRSCDQITVTASKKSINLCRFYLASGILRMVTQCVCAFKQEIALRKLSYHSVHCFKIPRTYVALVPYTEIQGSRSCDQITVTASKKSVNLCRFYLASGILRMVTQCVCAFKQEIALRKLSYHSVHCFKIPRTYVALVPYTKFKGQGHVTRLL